MIVTRHARKRMKERCGFNKKTCERMALKALNDGMTHAQTKGNLNKWVSGLYFSHSKANNIRIYGNFAYIFCGETLVTVMLVPVNLRKLAERNKQ